MEKTIKTITTTAEERREASDPILIRRKLSEGEYVKNIQVVCYDFDTRIFDVEITKNWHERHFMFY